MFVTTMAAAMMLAAEPTIVEARSEIVAVVFEPDGIIQIRGHGEDDYFVFGPDPLRREAFNIMIDRIRAEDGMATLRFAPYEARFERDGGDFLFPLCSIEYQGRRLNLRRSCRAEDPSRPSVEQQIAAARGLMIGGDQSAAAVSLGPVIDAMSDDHELLVSALATRAEAQEHVGLANTSGSEPSDRAYIAALADYQRLSKLVSDNSGARIKMAEIYETLGAYTEAMETYQGLADDNAIDRATLEINRAFVERRMHMPDEALARLNRLHESWGGGKQGMRFHYHRGMAHMHKGNWSEAVADFTAGIEDQPAYAWAYIMRACSSAELADFPAALADSQETLRRLEDYGNFEDSVGGRYNANLIRSNIEWLGFAVESGRQEPASGLCDGFWDNPEASRERSPLLDANH